MTQTTLPICISDPNYQSPLQVAQWYVLHVKSRQEKSLAASLDAMRIGYFLPLVVELRSHGGRRTRVEMPLFPGYLFLHGSRDDAFACDRTRRIAQIIEVPNQLGIAQELNNIRLALSSSQPMDPFPYLKAGAKVQVRSGPLQGLTGKVESRSQLDRLILQVQVLGQACSLEVDGAILDVLD
ncbi:MAG: UpxY family transcription antiterminator [Phycisphaeraceae bacterium]|nr:UpxY family transcription antiterminator [Phycisphaeraceae bacterium]